MNFLLQSFSKLFQSHPIPSVAQQPVFRLEFDETNEKPFGPCECCGTMSRTVWGFVYRDSNAYAVYYVRWTPGHVEKDALFDVIFGPWGDDAGPPDRAMCSMELRKGVGFRVRDARTDGRSTTLAETLLTREAFLGLPIKDEIFTLVDTIYLEDNRIAELRD
jgi:hypothetical protein